MKEGIKNKVNILEHLDGKNDTTNLEHGKSSLLHHLKNGRNYERRNYVNLYFYSHVLVKLKVCYGYVIFNVIVLSSYF